jgi:hypothetical protein
MTKKQLEDLQELGELQFSLDDCATVLQMPITELMSDKEAVQSYHRGRLKAIAEVRRAILTQAKQGSSPAQKQMLILIDQLNENHKIETSSPSSIHLPIVSLLSKD